MHASDGTRPELHFNGRFPALICRFLQTVSSIVSSCVTSCDIAQALAAWQRDVAAAYAAPRSSGARLGRLAAAYPELAPLLPAVEAGWAAGTTRAHLVPLEAINGAGGAPQVPVLIGSFDFGWLWKCLRVQEVPRGTQPPVAGCSAGPAAPAELQSRGRRTLRAAALIKKIRPVPTVLRAGHGVGGRTGCVRRRGGARGAPAGPRERRPEIQCGPDRRARR